MHSFFFSSALSIHSPSFSALISQAEVFKLGEPFYFHQTRQRVVVQVERAKIRDKASIQHTYTVPTGTEYFQSGHRPVKIQCLQRVAICCE